MRLALRCLVLPLVLGSGPAACAPPGGSDLQGSTRAAGSAHAHGVVVAKVVELGASAPARVERVFATPGARVERDQTLVVFDTRLLAARREEASAELARAAGQLALLEKGARPEELMELRARCDELHARLATADAAEKKRLEAEVAGADARFALASKGARREDLEIARAAVQAAQAVKRELELTESELRAPMPGVVQSIAVEPGASVQAHAVLVTLRDPARLFVEADLAPLVAGWQTGATVWVTSSLHARARFEGRVLELAMPGLGAASPSETARPAFVRVRIELLDGRDLLPPGSAVEVDLAP